MHKTIGMLAVLLAAQLVLAVGMSHTGPSLAMRRPDTPLLDLGERSVDRITISAPEEQQIVLVRQDDGWVLPGTGDYPADKSRVNRLLDELKGLRRGLAVATTKGAQQRFKVNDKALSASAPRKATTYSRHPAGRSTSVCPLIPVMPCSRRPCVISWWPLPPSRRVVVKRYRAPNSRLRGKGSIHRIRAGLLQAHPDAQAMMAYLNPGTVYLFCRRVLTYREAKVSGK